MARFGRTGPQLRPQPGSHPRRLTSGVPGRTYEDHFRAEIGSIAVSQLDEDSLILIPTMDYGPDDPMEDDTDAQLFVSHTTDTTRVWKTTEVYEQIGEAHPRIISFIHRDPFTGFPILTKPSGPPLVSFLAEHRLEMYSDSSGPGTSSRVLPKFRPLIYQWALHLISGLSFVHSHSVVFGDLYTEVCWLSSPSLSLSLVGFLDAGYRSNARGVLYNGGSVRDEPFHPLHIPRHDSVVPAPKTDLFLWGCLVYELMTSRWPGEGEGRAPAAIRQMITGQQWPELQTEYLGDIVRKCWRYEYESAASLEGELIVFLNGEGWQVDADGLIGFQAERLFIK